MPDFSEDITRRAQHILDAQGYLIALWTPDEPLPDKGTYLKDGGLSQAFSSIKTPLVVLGPATFEEYTAQQLRFYNAVPPPGWHERYPDERYLKLIAE